ncbi:MAG TPA: T9SS type A sorting domain-containing protein [Bacteroidia bacterium]
MNESLRFADEGLRFASESLRFADESSRFEDEVSRFKDERPRFKDESPRFKDESPRLMNERPRLMNERPCLMNENSRLMNESSRLIRMDSKSNLVVIETGFPIFAYNKDSPMSKKLIILFIVIASMAKQSQGQTPYVAIPDSNFVHYLKTIVPTAFKGDSLNKNSTLVTTTTHSINVPSHSIANLSGIQYFTSLTYLDCSSNSLTSVPALPNSIQTLYCGGNSLTVLPSLPNSLTVLVCGINSLTTLPALPNSLQLLSCLQNSLATLPALPNSLTSLICDNNFLTSLPALPNTLHGLGCSYNSLTSLPVLPNSLTGLHCENNNITCFPLFPTSITNTNYFGIDPNPYNCLPNYITAMSAANLATPLCAAGNSNGCAVAGIEQYNINNEVTVYPNPASTIMNVELRMQNEKHTLVITDMLGNAIYHSTLNTQHNTINVADLAEGVYTISITTNQGVVNKRLVIVR